MAMAEDSLSELVRTNLQRFSETLDTVEKSLKPVVELVQDEEEMEKMPAADKARAHIALSYAANSLFYLYLKTQGMDPSQHPVREELERVKQAFIRLSKATNADAEVKAEFASKSKLNMEAGARVIAANIDGDKGLKRSIKDAGKGNQKRKKSKKRKSS
mmetsp:Transcript_7668/g.11376  ORF Transcript_7668/g.11376 Transcript_7668/m.11376 type:complete len:159 (-) Transcript_7668:243-719(-)